MSKDLSTTMPKGLNITYPEMQVFTRTKSTIMSGSLMPCLETISIPFHKCIFVYFFSSEHFKCLMLCTNLHFSSII